MTTTSVIVWGNRWHRCLTAISWWPRISLVIFPRKTGGEASMRILRHCDAGTRSRKPQKTIIWRLDISTLLLVFWGCSKPNTKIFELRLCSQMLTSNATINIAAGQKLSQRGAVISSFISVKIQLLCKLPMNNWSERNSVTKIAIYDSLRWFQIPKYISQARPILISRSLFRSQMIGKYLTNATSNHRQ